MSCDWATWDCRYLFKRALLEDELARQELLEKREQKDKDSLPENELKWEQGKLKSRQMSGDFCENDFSADFDGHLELTEEQQIALLEEYEREQQGRKKVAPKRAGCNNNIITSMWH